MHAIERSSWLLEAYAITYSVVEKTSPTFRSLTYNVYSLKQYWSVDVRYIEKHRLPSIKRPFYLISILDNYSRAILGSLISLTENRWDYLEVLFAALSRAGAPHAIVSDGGDIFYCTQAMQVYAALGIGKERIEKGQPWQNYIETHFNIVRRMADAKFAVATSWEQALQIHQTWMHDYNTQRHWAHEKREDGCHSPAQVLGCHKGTIYPQKVLDRILFATCYTRSLDKHGFLRFQHWKLYAEEGLAYQPVTIWIYENLLRIEYKAVILSEYRVELQEDHTSLQQVSHPHLTPTPFRSLQLPLPDLESHERLLYWQMPSHPPVRRKRPVQEIVQLSLFDFSAREKAAGDYETKEANDLSSS